MVSLKAQHERAVGDRFISWYNAKNATAFAFEERGADPPDLIYRDGGRRLPVEITTAYYDDADAIMRWKSARRDPTASASWSGVGPDENLASDIGRRLVEKCQSRLEPGTVLVVAIYPALTTADEIAALLPTMEVPGNCRFAGIYVAGVFPASSDGSVEGYRCWRLGSVA